MNKATPSTQFKLDYTNQDKNNETWPPPLSKSSNHHSEDQIMPLVNF